MPLQASLDTFSEFASPYSLNPIEITEENLEDLLAYDDLFLDYFNAFLALPVFPKPLYYNRLTGTFLEVNGADDTLVDECPRPVTPPYGATDDEREHMLEWAKEERLPLFLRTQLFREFKLCKLLLRLLDDRCGSRVGSSRLIRGYSRQSDSYVSSFSNSADNSANVADFDDDNMWGDVRKSGLYQYRRPGSRAVSLPTRLGLAPEFNRPATTPSRPGDSKEDSNITKHPASADSLTGERNKSHEKSDTEKQSSPELLSKSDTQTSTVEPQPPKTSAKSKPGSGSRTRTPRASRVSSGHRASRVSSGHKASRQSSAHPEDARSVIFQEQGTVDYDAVFGEEEPDLAGETYVNFGDDLVSDHQTETDVKQLEGKHKMSFQHMKEQILGSVHGMDQMRTFLIGTAGGHLYEFWLDCENFKDTMEDYDDNENITIRNTLYRDIQDKYKLKLTEDAKKQIAQSANNVSLGHTVFIRTQYDVLRRLRAYWTPRFLIHKERLNELRKKNKNSIELQQEKSDPDDQAVFIGHDSMATSFFPSISLVNSMPVRADQIMQIANSMGWETVSKGGRRLDDRVKSAKPRIRKRFMNRTIREKFISALLADKTAGGPFKLFLEDHQDGELLDQLLFWEAVTEYGMAEDRSADRLLRMCHAWNMFNKFISKDGIHSIGVSPEQQDRIHQTLLMSRDFVEASLFSSVQQDVVDQLEKAWIRYLKEDLKAFLDCQVRPMESPPSTAADIEVYLDQERERLVVRRPRPWTRRYPPSTESERGHRLRTALSMAESIDEARRTEQRQRNREKRKIMEKERKKAVRAAMRRMKEAKMNKNAPPKQSNQDSSSRRSQTGSQGGASGELEDVVEEENPPTFMESTNNKAMINMFKKYLTEMEGKEAINHLNLFLDIDAYNNLGDGRTAKQKKDIQASHINKSYIEQGARKKVHLSDKVYTRMKTERDRPKSPTLKDAQHYIVPRLEELFKSFWEHQAMEMGVDNKAMASMSKAELAMRADDSMLNGEWAKKKRNGKLSTPISDSTGSIGVNSEPEREPEPPRNELSNVSAELLKLAMSDDDFKFKKARKRRGSMTLRRDQSNVSGLSRADSSDMNDNQDGTESGRESTSLSRRKRKTDGRVQPTREDKVDFLMALNQAAAGHLPLKMLYFYKYLVKHGEDDGVPYVDKDLFFYCEVHKFKECSHQYSDDEMLKRKIQSLMECYLECSQTPHCQIDIPNEIQQKTVRAVQRYLAGKDSNSNIFDEAQYSVFKELLPYWAGFNKGHKQPSDDKKVPVTKKERERLTRHEEMMLWKSPSAKRMSLPLLPNGVSIAAFSYTIGDGLKWREVEPLEEGAIMEEFEPSPGPPDSFTSKSVASDVRQKTNLSTDAIRGRRQSVIARA